MDQKQAHAMLRKAGLTNAEIIRLFQLRAKLFRDEETRRLERARRYLEFLRWLFLTGKLTDEIS